MSRTLLEDVEITNADVGPRAGSTQALSSPFSPTTAIPIGDHQYPPQSVPAHAPKGISSFVDGSGPIFSTYLDMATEEDKKMAESWKADADGILIFVRLYLLVPCFTPTDLSKTGLFSAAVASLISVSIQDIRPSSQDTSNFYLANILRLSPTRIDLIFPSLFPLPHSLHRRMPFG